MVLKKPWKILVVEADDSSASLINKFLERDGFKTQVAASGKEAMNALNKSSEKIIMLLDFTLPDMNADLLINKLNEKNTLCPFIVITGHNQARIAVDMMKLGAIDYIVKEDGYAELITPVLNRAIANIETEAKLKDSEKKIALKEKLFQNLVGNSPIGIFIIDDKKLEFVNSSFEKKIGYDLSEINNIDLLIDIIVDPKDKKKAAINFKSLSERRIKTSSGIYKIRKKNGEIIFIDSRSSLIEDGGRQKIFGFLSDITDSVYAEQKIRQSEFRFRQLFENIKNGVAIYKAVNNGKDFIFLDFNSAGEKIENVKREDLIGKSLLKCFPGVKKFGLFDVLRKVWKTGKPAYHPVSIYQDQRIQGWRDNYVYKLPSGEVVAVYEDVTGRKLAEEALKKSYLLMEAIIEGTDDFIALKDNSGRYLMVNSFAEKLAERKRKDIIGKFDKDIFNPQEAKGFSKGDREILETGKIITEEQSFQRNKGGLYFLTTKRPYYDQHNNIIGLIQFGRNITDLKEAQKKIQLRARQQSIVADLGQYAMSVQNVDQLFNITCYLLVNTLQVEYAKILELLPEGNSFVLRSGYGWKKGLVSKALVSADRESQAGFTLFSKSVVVVKDLDAESRFRSPALLKNHRVKSSMSLIIQGKEKPFGVLGIHSKKIRSFSEDDINCLKSIANILAEAIERHYSINRLAESEEKFRRLFESAREGVAFTSLQGEVLDANKAMAKFLGYNKPEEIIGKNTREFFFEVQEREKGLNLLKKKGYIDNYETKFKNKKGESVELLGSAVLRKDRSGNIVRIESFFADITEQKKNEDRIKSLSAKLLKSQDLERQRISQELHDSVGQTILAAKLNFKSFEANPQRFEANFSKGLEFIDKASDELREIYNNLYPNLLKDLGLKSAIKWLADNYLEIKGIKTNLKFESAEDFSFDLNFHIFRIVQEASSNIIKHSGAKKVKITIRLSKGFIKLGITDDGIGFNPEKFRQNLRSFGLENMKYRTEQMKGLFSIKSEKKAGTKISVEIPVERTHGH